MQSYPTPPELLRTEPMGPHMVKFHLGEGKVLHRFVEPDTGDPHDHPFSFTSHVLSGGYVEDVFTPQSDGTVHVERFIRRPGTSHRVEATTIHRLIALLGPECWTLIQPEPWQQKSGFWHFNRQGVWHRYWDEDKFQLKTRAA